MPAIDLSQKSWYLPKPAPASHGCAAHGPRTLESFLYQLNVSLSAFFDTVVVAKGVRSHALIGLLD